MLSRAAAALAALAAAATLSLPLAIARADDPAGGNTCGLNWNESEYGSQWEAICSVAEKLGPKAETVRLWVRQAERDTGRRRGPTTDELAELKRLKRENAELRRANDILKAASAFFGAELDRQSKK